MRTSAVMAEFSVTSVFLLGRQMKMFKFSLSVDGDD
jgi:hypothetical protein